jgi:hypothetical protein
LRNRSAIAIQPDPVAPVRSQRCFGDFGLPAACGRQNLIIEIIARTVELRAFAQFAVADPDESTGPVLKVEGG